MAIPQPSPQTQALLADWLQRNEPFVPIFEQARLTVGKIAQCDPNRVFPWQSLMEDLGLESIDYLDLILQLETDFKLEIPPADLFPEDIFCRADYLENGAMNAAGIAALQARLPWFTTREWAMDPTPANFGRSLIVQELVYYLGSKLAGL